MPSQSSVHALASLPHLTVSLHCLLLRTLLFLVPVSCSRHSPSNMMLYIHLLGSSRAERVSRDIECTGAAGGHHLRMCLETNTIPCKRPTCISARDGRAGVHRSNGKAGVLDTDDGLAGRNRDPFEYVPIARRRSALSVAFPRLRSSTSAPRHGARTKHIEDGPYVRASRSLLPHC